MNCLLVQYMLANHMIHVRLSWLFYILWTLNLQWLETEGIQFIKLILNYLYSSQFNNFHIKCQCKVVFIISCLKYLSHFSCRKDFQTECSQTLKLLSASVSILTGLTMYLQSNLEVLNDFTRM